MTNSTLFSALTNVNVCFWEVNNTNTLASSLPLHHGLRHPADWSQWACGCSVQASQYWLVQWSCVCGKCSYWWWGCQFLAWPPSLYGCPPSVEEWWNVIRCMQKCRQKHIKIQVWVWKQNHVKIKKNLKVGHESCNNL